MACSKTLTSRTPPEQGNSAGTTKHHQNNEMPQNNGRFDRVFSQNEELLLILRKNPIKVSAVPMVFPAVFSVFYYIPSLSIFFL